MENVERWLKFAIDNKTNISDINQILVQFSQRVVIDKAIVARKVVIHKTCQSDRVYKFHDSKVLLRSQMLVPLHFIPLQYTIM